VHDVKELFESHNDNKLHYDDDHGTRTRVVIRTIIMILVIGITTKIYKKPPVIKLVAAPLPN